MTTLVSTVIFLTPFICMAALISVRGDERIDWDFAVAEIFAAGWLFVEVLQHSVPEIAPLAQHAVKLQTVLLFVGFLHLYLWRFPARR